MVAGAVNGHTGPVPRPAASTIPSAALASIKRRTPDYRRQAEPAAESTPLGSSPSREPRAQLADLRADLPLNRLRASLLCSILGTSATTMSALLKSNHPSAGRGMATHSPMQPRIVPSDLMRGRP